MKPFSARLSRSRAERARSGLRPHAEVVARSATLLASAASAVLLALAAVPATAAGRVDVNFVEPETFGDVGWGSVDRERNLQVLAQHFQALAARLPDTQTLRVEVLDVDLAGEPRPGAIQDFRVVRGGADWPAITLRYVLDDRGSVLASGEERVTDMNYLFSRTVGSDHGPLPYERRLIQRWFQERFEPQRKAQVGR
jgi:hypothetical protein